MANRVLLLVAITSLLLATIPSSTLASKPAAAGDDDDEYLSFIEEEEKSESAADHHHGGGGNYEEFDDHFDDEDDESGGEGSFENYDDFDESKFGQDGGEDAHSMPEVDEKDVVVLKERNFSDVIEKNRFVMVEFYAPWCGHCQALAPEYAAAATELKADGVVLAKVDATEENELSQEYDVQGFPTVIFFIDGDHKPYTGQRTKEGIVAWIRKKTGPGVANLTSVEEAQKVLDSESKVVLAFLNSLVGPESEEFAGASRLEDDVNFYQTVNPDVAKLFHIDADAKRPAVVMVKKEAEKLSHFDGKYTKSAIAEFAFANKLPLVTIFTRESAPMIFESAIKKQILLFATKKDSEKVVPIFEQAARLFKGKLIFVFVESDNEDVGKPVSEYFGVTGDAPKVLAYTGNDDGKKFFLEGEVTLDTLKTFGGDFLEDKLKPFFKSDPIPETNDGDVKIVVGDNFDEIVLDESKDVLLEIYAPWCGHCQSLEPTYKKLAKHLKGVDSIVIAKMDGTTNEHPRAKSDGFPTILFFPAGNKSFDPGERTVVEFYKFLKKNAAITFKLQKPTTPKNVEETATDDAAKEQKSSSGLKDEL
uniref:Protein disulfide-isomerase n=1 Tax=Kalanchoe fedtschenkoi TaxID=63787 RepID=A0A7N0V2A6_KALFE